MNNDNLPWWSWVPQVVVLVGIIICVILDLAGVI